MVAPTFVVNRARYERRRRISDGEVEQAVHRGCDAGPTRSPTLTVAGCLARQAAQLSTGWHRRRQEGSADCFPSGKRAALFGTSEGGPMSLLFAATYPRRTSALVLYGAYARRSWAPDHTCGNTEQEWQVMIDGIEQGWGDAGRVDVRAPSADASYRQWGATYQRLAASPGAAVAVMQMNKEIDVRPILPAIRIPTLILHRTGDGVTRVEQARYLARHIPGARLVELAGALRHPLLQAELLAASTPVRPLRKLTH
jgi:pimeloyl-ACP methyl ester carboxylesterase